jgi:dTDP-4-dehydrorhamnose reductase
VWIAAKTQSPTRVGYSQFPAPANVVAWVRENLPLPDTCKVILQQFYGITQGNKHVDAIRTAAYNYLVLPNDATTSWFDEDNNLLESVQYEPYVWYKHDSSTKHQVTNVSSTRLAISVYEPINRSSTNIL